MSRGSIGTSTGTIIYTRGRRKRNRSGAVRSNCKNCVHAVVNVDGVANCIITGDIAVHKSYCEYYKHKDKVARAKAKAKSKAMTSNTD